MKIAFGAFDWGLGHATRDIPVVKALLEKGNSVDIISTGKALEVLRLHLGRKCRYFDVPSVYPPYSRMGFFSTKFLFCIPKMISNLKRARKISSKIIEEGKYDRVISDCRFDVYDKKNNSVLFNHQLRFQSPLFPAVIEKANKVLMRHYSTVVVPDFPDRPLSGELSHNRHYDGRVEYIGHVSNLRKMSVKKDIDYFISVSGPEPQRSLFEKKVLKQLKFLDGSVVVACGNPSSDTIRRENGVLIYGYLRHPKQSEIMNRSKFIISRPGYTTVMEMVELGKTRAFFVPTPGQTEQEYLARMYREKGFYYSHAQSGMNLRKGIECSNEFRGFRPKWNTEKSIRKFVGIVNG
jgi:UDP-N-acetylglucosamine transferase subunit ALG13